MNDLIVWWRAHWPDVYENVDRYPFISSPVYLFIPPLFYLATVYIGQKVMAKRKQPINIPMPVRALHNLILVLLSVYMTVEIARQALFNLGFGIICNDLTKGAAGYGLADVIYVFTMSKLYEFIDTWIMILRKNDRQVTFLHVYHHSSIYVVWWLIMKYFPGGDFYQSSLFNSFVHVVMYTYYFLKTVWPQGEYKWKKYITQLQIIQFVSFILQSLIICYYQCVALSMAVFVGIYAFTLLALFVNFYVRGYKSRPKAKAAVVSKKSRKQD